MIQFNVFLTRGCIIENGVSESSCDTQVIGIEADGIFEEPILKPARTRLKGAKKIVISGNSESLSRFKTAKHSQFYSAAIDRVWIDSAKRKIFTRATLATQFREGHGGVKL